MGFLSALGLGKPKRVQRSSGESRQLENVQSQLGEAAQFQGAAKSYLASIADTTRAEAKARGTANADVMQSTTGGNFDPMHPGMQALDRSLSRTKALARMGWAGADQAKNNGFYERMQAVQFGKRAKSGMDVNGALSDIAYENVAARNQRGAIKSSMIADGIGTLAGAGFGAWQNSRTPTSMAPGWYQGRLPSEVGK